MRLILAILLFGSVVASAQTNRPLAAVDTVADLIARKPVTNERLLVSGWRTPGDCGAQRVSGGWNSLLVDAPSGGLYVRSNYTWIAVGVTNIGGVNYLYIQ